MSNKILLTLGKVAYTSKPEDGASVNNELIGESARHECTIGEFADAISKGISFCPSVFNGIIRSKANFQQTELIGIDIDDGDWLIGDIYNICGEYGLMPCVIYETFNSQQGAHKWRVLFRLDKILTNSQKDVVDLQLLIVYLIDCFMADKACSDVSRIYYGTNKLCQLIDEHATNNTGDLLFAAAQARIANKKYANKQTDSWLHETELQDWSTIKQLYRQLAARDKGKARKLSDAIDYARLWITNPEADGKSSRYIAFRDAIFRLGNISHLSDATVKYFVFGWMDEIASEVWADWRHYNRREWMANNMLKSARKRMVF